MASAADRDRGKARRERSSARLMAVQALYQRAMTGVALPRLLDEFHRHRLTGLDSECPLAPAEADFFDDVVTGVVAREAELDRAIAAHLAPGWTLARLDPLLRQLLRAGAFELLARPEIPRAAVISAYVDVAHAFYPAAEAGFVNALLDRIGRETAS
ncbi:transcription antitermination factor NusB [Thermaurantiacus sp.]